MVAVTVLFEIQAEHVDAFRVAVLQHAKNSLTNEAGCRRFDVCVDPTEEHRFFLYEMYDDDEAFDLHRGADYLAKFAETIKPWVATQQLNVWQLASSPTATAV